MTISGAKLIQRIQISGEVTTVLASAGGGVDRTSFALCVYSPADSHDRTHAASLPQNATVWIALCLKENSMQARTITKQDDPLVKAGRSIFWKGWAGRDTMGSTVRLQADASLAC